MPKALESPVAIIASKTKPDSSIVAIIDLSGGDKPLFAAVEIDGFGKLNGELIDSNAITSIHVRNNRYLADILIEIKQKQSAELYDIVNITPKKITEHQHLRLCPAIFRYKKRIQDK